MPSKDYEAFNAKMTGDVNQAFFLGAGFLEKASPTPKSAFAKCASKSWIPSNSAIEIEQVLFHKLRFGDFCVRP